MLFRWLQLLCCYSLSICGKQAYVACLVVRSWGLWVILQCCLYVYVLLLCVRRRLFPLIAVRCVAVRQKSGCCVLQELAGGMACDVCMQAAGGLIVRCCAGRLLVAAVGLVEAGLSAL